MKRYTEHRGYEPEVLQRLHEVQMEMLADFIKVCEKHKLTYFAVYGTAIGAVRHQGFIPWDDDIDVGMLRKDYDRLLEVFDKELGEKYFLLTPELDERYACTVTHMEKRGTKFVSESSQDLKCEQCIFMDIFPLDSISENRVSQLLQSVRTNFWGKMLFLAGTAYPVINVDGLVGYIASWICRCAHCFLKVFHVSPRTLYRKYVKACTVYNKKGKQDVTSFDCWECANNSIKAEDIFPVKRVKFEDMEINIPANSHEYLSKVYGDYMQIPPKEQQVNHMPLVIDFGDKIED